LCFYKKVIYDILLLLFGLLLNEGVEMKASTLGDVIRDFNNQRPLNPERKEEWESFYVDTQRFDINLIRNEFLRSSPGHKVLFGGHMGNGKSTELNKFVYEPHIQKRFAVIKFDIREILNLHDIEIVELLLTICFQTLTFAEENNVMPAPYIKEELENLEKFFHDKLMIESSRISSKGRDIGIESEAGGGFKLPFLKLKAGFYAKMKGQLESRRMVRDEYRPRLNELIDLVKLLLTDLKTKLKGKEPLIVIDGLDRTSLKAAEKLFVEDGQNVAMIDSASMLLTVPISIIHSVKSAVVKANLGKIWVLKNLRLRTRDNKKDEIAKKNWNLMKQTILRRMEPQLISDLALEMAIHYSGGVFTTLIDLVGRAALESETFGGTTIGEKDMEKAVIAEKIDKTRTLNRSHWEILLEIDRNKNFLSEMDEKKLELLAGLFVLEYINEDEWYDVSPLLQERLEKYRKIREGGKGGKKKNGVQKR
jgi:hypothetical protein